MDQIEHPSELEREIERAKRLASGIGDQTTYQRLKAFVEELRQRLQQRLAARRSKEGIRARARELWEQHGQPAGRDLEFWLQAESELTEHRSE
jgi:hypothetical protein